MSEVTKNNIQSDDLISQCRYFKVDFSFKVEASLRRLMLSCSCCCLQCAHFSYCRMVCGIVWPHDLELLIEGACINPCHPSLIFRNKWFFLWHHTSVTCLRACSAGCEAVTLWWIRLFLHPHATTASVPCILSRNRLFLCTLNVPSSFSLDMSYL